MWCRTTQLTQLTQHSSQCRLLTSCVVIFSEARWREIDKKVCSRLTLPLLPPLLKIEFHIYLFQLCCNILGCTLARNRLKVCSRLTLPLLPPLLKIEFHTYLFHEIHNSSRLYLECLDTYYIKCVFTMDIVLYVHTFVKDTSTDTILGPNRFLGDWGSLKKTPFFGAIWHKRGRCLAGQVTHKKWFSY